ncbi:MAG: DUF2057 family protein [Marinobacter sp.]
MYARLKKVSPVGLKQLTAVLAILVIAGCSSTGLSRVKTWEGESPAEVAVLKAPSTIKVREVNGREVGNFLMEDLAIDYELRPGRNMVVFTHKTIWAKPGVVRDGESAVDVVETGPQQVVIDAGPGEEYRFDTPEVSNRREARQLARDFSVAVVADNGSTVARSEPYQGQSSQPVADTDQRSGDDNDRPAAAGNGQDSGVPVTGTDGGPGDADSGVDRLEAMKTLWQRASGEEKREFLRWAFD